MDPLAAADVQVEEAPAPRSRTRRRTRTPRETTVEAIADTEQATQKDEPAPVTEAASGLGDGSVRHAGLVIDRTQLFQHPGSEAAPSIDEFAVALHRDAAVSIDPALGWHLWGTDLCLQAPATILETPLFHNSSTAWQLPEAFHASAGTLLAKYPQRERIPTLCGELQRKAALAA